jgi:hypothetical protein
MPGPAGGPTWPSPTAVPPATGPVDGAGQRLDPRYRSLGAIVGAGIGAVAMAAVYLATLVPAVAAVGIVEILVGPEGLLTISGAGMLLFWATGPIAAAVTGWMMAPRALAGDRWSGVAMGFATYFLAVLIGPFLVLGPMALTMAPIDGGGAADLGSLLAMGTWVPVGAVLLFPLLGPCVVGGVAWAAAVRRVVATSGGVGLALPSRPQPMAWMVATAIVLGVLWFGATMVLIGFAQSDVWMD